MAKEIEGNILKSIEIITDEKIKKLNYDKSFKSTIWGKNVDGTYQISYRNQIYNVPNASGTELEVGQSVWVNIPSGIFRNMHISAGGAALSDSGDNSTDTTKVEASAINGNILINGTETVVYTHPAGTNPHGTTKSDVGLDNVDNTSDMNKPVSTAQQEALDAAYANSNAYTDARIAELINGAPTTLDTLKEIADAMAEHENVVEVLNESIGTKAAQAELDTHTGNSTIHITSTERTNWNAAHSMKHSHSNQSVLDATTASFTEALNTKLNGIDSGANAYTHPDSGATSGTYRSVTVDTKGHVTVGSNPTITIAQGGTGATTATGAEYNILGSMPESNTGITDEDRLVLKHSSPSNTTGVTLFKKATLLWNYIKNKADSIYAKVSHTHNDYVNQNAFSHVTTGDITLSANTSTDTLTLSGDNVTITPDTSNNRVTIGIRSANVTSALSYTPVTSARTVNGKALSADITLSADDIGADISGSADTALTSAKAYTDEAIADLINSAPSTLDTLGEIATAMEENDEVVAALEAAIGNKQDTITGSASTITSNNLTTSRALISNTSGKVAVSNVSSTELEYLDGVTGNIQTQLDSKSDEDHTHLYAGSSTAGGSATSAVKLATARTIDGVSFNGSAAITHYGTCNTAAATAAKTVSISGFSLVTGARIAVKFSYTNTASSPTLNVNSTGAKSITLRNSAIGEDFFLAGKIYDFIYNGSSWDLVTGAIDDTIEWKKYASGTGATSTIIEPTAISPREFLIEASFGTYSIFGTIVIPYSCLTSTAKIYRTGYFQNASNGGMVSFSCSLTSIGLALAYINGSDVTSATTWTAYYR